MAEESKETLLDLSKKKQEAINSLEEHTTRDFVIRSFRESLSVLNQITILQQAKLDNIFGPIKNLYIRNVFREAQRSRKQKNTILVVLAIMKLAEEGELPIRQRGLLEELKQKFGAYKNNPSDETYGDLLNTYNESFLDEEMGLRPIEVEIARIRALCAKISEMVSQLTDPRSIIAKNKELTDLQRRLGDANDKQSILTLSKAREVRDQMVEENKIRCTELKKEVEAEIRAVKELMLALESIISIQKKDAKIRQKVLELTRAFAGYTISPQA